MGKGSSGLQISGTAMGILAIIAGVLVLWNVVSLHLIVGIYLIVFGIIAVVNK